MRELRSLLNGTDASVRLDLAALQLATIEFPALDPGLFLRTLDSHAVELAAAIPDGCDGEDFVTAANEYLFDELGFEGNQANYYDPRNSCVNEVLTRRTGIPITLSLVYIEIARRLAKPVYGIGLPGHFLVLYRDREFQTFIDPFHRGRLLTARDCAELAGSAAGVDIRQAANPLQPVSNRYILVRMLNNLRGVYLQIRAHQKALAVLDLLVHAFPTAPEERRERGLLHLELKNYVAAKADLREYLRLAPRAPDRPRIEKKLTMLGDCG